MKKILLLIFTLFVLLIACKKDNTSSNSNGTSGVTPTGGVTPAGYICNGGNCVGVTDSSQAQYRTLADCNSACGIIQVDTTLNGTWNGTVVSPPGTTTQGCWCGHIEESMDVTFSKNGNSVTIYGFLPSFLYGFTSLSASLLGNTLTIPTQTDTPNRRSFVSGTITINGNSGFVSCIVSGLATDYSTCCTYTCSGVLTKQ